MATCSSAGCTTAGSVTVSISVQCSYCNAWYPKDSLHQCYYVEDIATLQEIKKLLEEILMLLRERRYY